MRMRTRTTKPETLGHGGESWNGWRFGPYGRAREWRLIAPDGETFTAGDIQSLRGFMLDVDFLRGRVQALQGQVEAHACHFNEADLLALHAAIAVLGRVLPNERRRRRPQPRALHLVNNA